MASFYLEADVHLIDGLKLSKQKLPESQLTKLGRRAVLTTPVEKLRLLVYLGPIRIVTSDSRPHQEACGSWLFNSKKRSKHYLEPLLEYADRASTVTARDRRATMADLKKAQREVERCQKQLNVALEARGMVVRAIMTTFGPGPYEIDGKSYDVVYRNRYHLRPRKKPLTGSKS